MGYSGLFATSMCEIVRFAPIVVVELDGKNKILRIDVK